MNTEAESAEFNPRCWLWAFGLGLPAWVVIVAVIWGLSHV